MNHSIIPPSAAGIWGKPDGCTGWVEMSQRYPETEESPEAAEGVASHEIAASLIQKATCAFNEISPIHFVGKTASNGIIFTKEMYEAAKIYADNVANIMRNHSVFGGPNFGIEKQIKAPQIHELSFGTTDCFLFDSRTYNLYIWDYKFGFEIVEVFENWQSINYLAGLFNELNFNGLTDQKITVHIRIAQPRAFHRDGEIREWVVNAGELRSYFNILYNNAQVALSADAMCRSGNHCKYCSARHACATALTAGMRLYEVSTNPTPIELSPEALGVQFAIVQRAKKQLEYLESGFEEQVKGLIRSGVNVPGWMVEQGYGREKWEKSIKEVLTMGNMLGFTLKKPDDAITPNQARKLGIDSDVIKAFSTKPRTGLKIVPDNGNKAKRIFKS